MECFDPQHAKGDPITNPSFFVHMVGFDPLHELGGPFPGCPPLPLQRLADLAAGASVLIEVLGVRFLVEECFGYWMVLSMFWFSWIPCFSA